MITARFVGGPQDGETRALPELYKQMEVLSVDHPKGAHSLRQPVNINRGYYRPVNYQTPDGIVAYLWRGYEEGVTV